MLRKGEASLARRGRFANILAVEIASVSGDPSLEAMGGEKTYQLLAWKRMSSIGFSPGETPVWYCISCQLFNRWTSRDQRHARQSAQIAGPRHGGEKLTAGVERSLLMAIVGAMVEKNIRFEGPNRAEMRSSQQETRPASRVYRCSLGE